MANKTTSRVQRHRARLRHRGGKPVSIHMSADTLRYIQTIIELLSTKDIKLTTRDAVSLSVKLLADHIQMQHQMTKSAFVRDESTLKKNREKWRYTIKITTEEMKHIRSEYHTLPRGRRPKGSPPPPEDEILSYEEELAQLQQALMEYDKKKAIKKTEGIDPYPQENGK